MSNVKQCTNCGNPSAGGQQMCPQCGAPLLPASAPFWESQEPAGSDTYRLLSKVVGVVVILAIVVALGALLNALDL